MFTKTVLLLAVASLSAAAGIGGRNFNPSTQPRFPPQQPFQVRQDLDDNDDDHLFSQPQQHFSGAAQPQQQFTVRAQSHDDDDDDVLNLQRQHFSGSAQPIQQQFSVAALPQHFSGSAQPRQQQFPTAALPQHFSGAAQPQQQFSVRAQSHEDDSDTLIHLPQQQFSGGVQPQQQFSVREDGDEDDDEPQVHFSGPAQPQFTGLSQSQRSGSIQQPQQTFVASAPRQPSQQTFVASIPQQQSQQTFTAQAPRQQPQQTFAGPFQRQQTGQTQQFPQQQFRVSSDDDDNTDSWEEGEIRVQTNQQPRQQLSLQPRAQQRYEEPAKYQFDYAVRDSHSGNDFGHSETRDGDNTRGEYFVRLPDGRLQRVSYSVIGNSGFLAQVSYEGEARFDEPRSQSQLTRTYSK